MYLHLEAPGSNRDQIQHTQISNIAVQVALEEMKCQPSVSMKNYQEAYQPKSFHSSNHKVSDAATCLLIRCRLPV